MEGLKVADANLVVYVHPSKNNKVSQAILCELSSLLFTYNEIFDGIVLAYDVNLMDDTAKILPGIHPYFGVGLKAKLFLFSPKPDMLLEGKVVKLTHESIHIIVLGFTYATIPDKDIREEFVHKTKHGQDVYASRPHKRHVIKVGTMIRFLVKSFDEEILHVVGSLMPDHTGSVYWLEKSMDGVSQIERSAKKRESEGELILPEQDTVGGDSFCLDYVQKMKKSKKQRVREES